MSQPSHPPRPAALPGPWVMSAFWGGSALMWLLLLLVLMPSDVLHFVGEADKGRYLGLLGGIGAVMALVLPPLVGSYSDRIGKRMPLIRLGVGCNVAGLAVMALAAQLLTGMAGFWVYTLGFLLVQFGNNYATAPYSALIPDLVPEEQRGRYSGVLGVLQCGGQLLGGALFLLVGALHLPGVASYALMALALVLSAWVTLRGVPEPQRTPVTAPQSLVQQLGLEGLRELFAHQPFLWVFITRAFFSLGQYSVQPFLHYYVGDVLRQSDKAAETATIALLMLIIVGAVLTTSLGGKLSDRVGRKPIIYLAGTLMALMALALLFAPNLPVAAVIALVFGLGYGAFTSVDWALGSDAMPSKATYARDMAVWHVAFVGPQLVETPQGALLDWGNHQGHNLGYTLVFGLAAAFFALGVLLVRRVPDTRVANPA